MLCAKINPDQEPFSASTSKCGPYFMLEELGFPAVPRRPAPGKRRPWEPGTRLVCLSKNGEPLTNGEMERWNPHWHASPPAGSKAVLLEDISFAVFSSSRPGCSFAGYRFHSPTSSLRPEKVCFQSAELLLLGLPNLPPPATKPLPSPNLTAAINLALVDKVKILSMASGLAFIEPRRSLSSADWESLGYRCFDDGVTPPVLTVTIPNLPSGLFISTHDVPAVKKAFPSAELITGTAGGTIWRGLETGRHPSQIQLVPWMKNLPPGKQVETSWQSIGHMWFAQSCVPRILETQKVSVRYPWGQSNQTNMEIGVPVQSTVIDKDSLREGTLAGRDCRLFAKPESFLTRPAALLLHKAYHLDAAKKIAVFWVDECGKVEYKRGRGYYWVEDLKDLPPRSSRLPTRRELEEKYGKRAVPANFWKFSESAIAARAALYDQASAGTLYSPEDAGRHDGFVPSSMVCRLTGLPPIPDPCHQKASPRRLFYPKIPVEQFFKNQEWVNKLLKEMGREYDWVLVNFMAGKLNLRAALVTSALV
jgi:hypothetical protein